MRRRDHREMRSARTKLLPTAVIRRMGTIVGHGRGGRLLKGLRRVEPGFLTEVAWSVLVGSRRSLAHDCRRVVGLMAADVRIEGLPLVPRREPFLLVANHFQSADLWVGWVAAAITAAVAEAREPERSEIHWVIISEWRWFELGGVWVPNPVSAWLFPRACHVWGLIPMPARPSDVAGRARALRRVLAYLGVRRGEEAAAPEPVAMFPEGRATMALGEAKPGVGAFLHRVNSRGVPLLPAGVYQESGTLFVRFGGPFALRGAPSEEGELDDWARQQVMVAIGRLLPRRLWGAYADAIARAE